MPLLTSVGGALGMAMTQKTPAPPPLPAPPPPEGRAPGATVRLGSNAEQHVNNESANPNAQRKTGNVGVPLRGRGGLAL